jgi:hypothetical protein
VPNRIAILDYSDILNLLQDKKKSVMGVAYFLGAGLALVGRVFVIFPVPTLGIPPALRLPPALRSASNPASARDFMMVNFPVAPALVAITVSMFLLICAESFYILAKVEG